MTKVQKKISAEFKAKVTLYPCWPLDLLPDGLLNVEVRLVISERIGLL